MPDAADIAHQCAMHPPLSSCGVYAEPTSVPATQARGVDARPAKCNQWKRTLEISDRHETAERHVVSGVRRCRQQDQRSCTVSQQRNCRMAVRVARDTVSLVDDEEIPYEGLEGTNDFRTFDVVSRGEDERVSAPGIASIEKRQALQRCRVEDHRLHVKAPDQFILPLCAKPGRTDDQHVRILPPREHLRDDHPCLYRLAKTNFVRDQDSRCRSAEERECRFELVGEYRDIGRRGGAQRVH